MRYICKNVEVKDLIDYEHCVIMYDMVSLDGIFDEIVLTYKYVPTKLKYREMKCVEMNFNKGKRNITLAVDPNYEHSGKTDMTWQDVRQWCIHFGMPFKSQTFSSLFQELREEHYKPLRHNFSKEEREMFLNDHPICNMCQKNLTLKSMYIDHIVPLSAGGGNDLDNLQALCQPCHFSKTHEEQLNHEHSRATPTMSTFNDATLDIMKSDACKVYAFVEKYGGRQYEYTFVHEANADRPEWHETRMMQRGC